MITIFVQNISVLKGNKPKFRYQYSPCAFIVYWICFCLPCYLCFRTWLAEQQENRLQISPLILHEFRRINQLLLPLKSTGKRKFLDDFIT